MKGDDAFRIVLGLAYQPRRSVGSSQPGLNKATHRCLLRVHLFGRYAGRFNDPTPAKRRKFVVLSKPACTTCRQERLQREEAD